MTRNLPLIVPAHNSVQFSVSRDSNAPAIGTPRDVERVYTTLKNSGLADSGMEILLQPSILANTPKFRPNFIAEFSNHPFKTVHILECDPQYLDAPKTGEQLERFSDTLSEINCSNLVIHADFFVKNIRKRYNLLRSCLPKVRVLVENTGFENHWGSRPENITTILNACPDFGLCLDIAHVHDYTDISFSQFKEGVLGDRISEIHWSCSTHHMKTDPYEDKGFQGYGPLHAFFSLSGIRPSASTIKFVTQFPIVLEGLHPKEDINFKFLQLERKTLLNGDS